MPRPARGRREVGLSSATPWRGRGARVGRYTSVTASRMTDAYGASTPEGCTAGLRYLALPGSGASARLPPLRPARGRGYMCRLIHGSSGLRPSTRGCEAGTPEGCTTGLRCLALPSSPSPALPLPPASLPPVGMVALDLRCPTCPTRPTRPIIQRDSSDNTARLVR